jgi:hypothetical protein
LPRKSSKKTELAALLMDLRPTRVDEPLFGDLLARLAPVSESYLRSLLRKADVPLAPIVEGVRLGSLEELERTLVDLAREYAGAGLARRRQVRSLVLEAKMRARHNGTDEIRLWIQTWLENPEPFPAWVAIRKRLLPATAARELPDT